jgi:GNAT superfamily N-acetyltransferase
LKWARLDSNQGPNGYELAAAFSAGFARAWICRGIVPWASPVSRSVSAGLVDTFVDTLAEARLRQVVGEQVDIRAQREARITVSEKPCTWTAFQPRRKSLARLTEPDEDANREMLGDRPYRRVHVEALGTANANQRQGLATQLVEAAEAWAREQGARAISAGTYLESPVSIPFWERRMGYRRRSVKFTKRLD